MSALSRRLLPICSLSLASALAACGTTAGNVTVAVAPQSASVATGGAVQFSAAVGGSSDAIVTWSVQEGPSGGTITQGGAYIAPANAGTYHVLAASHADPSRGGVATVVVSAGLAVSITLDSATAELLENGTRQFTATVTNAADTTVSWGVLEGVTGGSVSSTGLYTAPANDGTFHVVATANADNTKSVTAEVKVDPPPAVVTLALSPTTASVAALGQASFGARVTGTANTAVTWSVEESQGGSIDASGLYTAPNLAGTFHVLATSAADPSKTAEAAVTVGAPALIGITISPLQSAIAASAQQQFIAAVTNTTNTAVTWAVQESGAGSIDGNGLYTAPNAGGTFHVVATSAADTSKSATAAITVSPPPAITVAVSPATSTLPADAQLQLTAAVSNASTSAVTWSIDESSGGAITTGGLYTAPHAAGTYHVRATSNASTSVFGEGAITVTAASSVVVSVSPSSVTLAAGAQQQFGASVLNASSTSVTWDIVEGASGGSLSTTGLYTAPLAGGTFHVRATSISDNSKSGTATVTVTPPPAISVSISPTAATLAADGQQQFTTTVSNATSTTVTFSVQESGGGSVNPSGLYTAPHAAGTFHVRAASTADNTKFADATVTVLAPPAVTVVVNPGSASIAADAQIQLSATVSNASGNTGVTWSIDESNAGAVNQLGLFTAPHAAGTFHVRATSVADPSKFAECAVTVAAPPAATVAVSPKIAYVQTSTGWQFAAAVGNASDTSVTWSVVGTGAGTITSAGGYYTAPATAGSYTVKATSNADPSKSDTATVVVSTTPPNVVVTVTPASPEVATHGTIALSAAVTGTSNSAVTWSVPNGSSAGTIDQSGNYTAPATAGTYTVRATSVANGSASGSVNIRVDSVTVSVTPATKTVPQGGSQQFNATVTIGNGGPLPTTVTWSVLEGANAGSVTQTGLYTTNQSPLTAHVVATSTADSTVTASAVVNVTAPIAPPPTNVVATPGNTSVALTWSSATGATGYNVYFAQHGALLSATVAELTGAASGVVINGLNNGTTYDFAVSSVNSGGESGDSAIATATPGDTSLPKAYAIYPINNAASVPLLATPYIQFSKPMNNATVASAFTLKKGSTVVQGAVSFDGVRAIFTPVAPFDPRAVYTASVAATALDAEGNAFAGTSWSFTTQAEPTAAVHLLLGDGSITVSWSAVAGASYYTLYRGAVSGGPYYADYGTLGLSFTDTGLSNGTNYYYVVSATPVDGEGALSPEVAGSPSAILPFAPGTVQATPGNNQVILSWSNAGANLTYTILRATASGGAYTALTTSGNSLGFVDNTVTNGTAWYYVIRSVDTQQNSSANSMEVTATPLASYIAAPGNLKASSGNSYVGLTWNAVTGATGYVILRTTTYGGPYTQLYSTSAQTTSWVDINASNNVTYFYVVAAVDASGNVGTYSLYAEGDPASYALTLAPTLSVNYGYNGRVSLSWTQAYGAINYQVQRAIGAGAFANAGGQQGCCSFGYLDTSLSDGTIYKYQVIAQNGSATATSNIVTVTPADAPITAPGNVQVYPGKSAVSVTWTPVPGATGYNVSYGVSPGSYLTTQPVSAYPLYTFANLANGSPFYFAVNATGINSAGTNSTSLYSAEMQATPLAVNVPGQVTSVFGYAGAGVNNLFWTAIAVPGNPNSNPVTYFVYRTTGLGQAWGNPLNSTATTATGYIDTNVVNGQLYYYAIVPYLNGAPGPWSSPIALTPYSLDPQPPGNVVVHPGNGTATLTWNAEPGVSYYDVLYGAVSGGPYTSGASPSVVPSTNLASANQTPTYVVIRSHMTGDSYVTSADSAEVIINDDASDLTVPSLSAATGNDEVALNWPSVAYASGYNIYRTTGLVTWKSIGNTTATRTGFIDNNIVNDVTYCYAVAGVGVNGESVWSNVVTVTPHVRQPLPPTGLVAHAGAASATLTWSPVAGATFYYIYTSAIPGGPYSYYTTVYGNEYGFSNLGGAPLYVVLETYDQGAGVLSSYSAEASIVPDPNGLTPTYFTAAAHLRDGVYLSWSPLAAASGYHLYRAVYYSNNQAVSWSLIASPSQTSYLDPLVTNGVTYQYAVAGVKSGVEGPWVLGNAVTPTATDPLAPVNVTAQPGNGQVTLVWDAIPGATYYYVYASATQGGPYSFYTNPTVPGYTLPAPNGVAGYYTVAAYVGSTLSGYSQEVSATALAALPTAPSVQQPVKATGQLTLNWYATTGATSYLVYRWSPGQSRWALAAQTSTLTYADTSVQSGITYQYCVAAANGAGVGAWSNATSPITE